MNKVAILIDVQDQFFRVSKKWEGKRINYTKYLEQAKEFGTISRAFAYGTQVEDRAEKFINVLKYLNFETFFKQVKDNEWFNWSVTMCADMLRLSTQVDTIILGVGYPDLAPYITAMRDRGICVIMMGCGINKELKHVANKYIEIEESMLEEKE
jgi:uncharacterized LabA/DUF88 family protein